MKKTLRRAIAAMSAIAVITASSVPVSAVGYITVIGGSNNCNSNFGSDNFNFSMGGYCPNYTDINALLEALGLQNIFGNFGSNTGNDDNNVTAPETGNETNSDSNGSSNGTNGNTTAPDTGFFTPDSTPSKPDAPTQDNTPSKPDNSTSSSSIDDSSVSEYEKRVAELVNIERAKYGLSALTLNTELSAVARAKSQDMKDKNYFSHTSPTYGSPFEMMSSFGIKYKTAGENIAMGYRTPEAVVQGWMNSEGHRANILNSSFKEIGVGYVASGNYWTQMFIG